MTCVQEWQRPGRLDPAALRQALDRLGCVYHVAAGPPERVAWFRPPGWWSLAHVGGDGSVRYDPPEDEAQERGLRQVLAWHDALAAREAVDRAVGRALPWEVAADADGLPELRATWQGDGACGS